MDGGDRSDAASAPAGSRGRPIHWAVPGVIVVAAGVERLPANSLAHGPALGTPALGVGVVALREAWRVR